jgi:ubiquinone/menaquinone biosynthesis C-methylase UbiE
MLPRALSARRYAVFWATLPLAASLAATALMFPYWTDPPREETSHAREFYTKAYDQEASHPGFAPANEPLYVTSARHMQDFYGVAERIREFIATYHLETAKILEAGAGSGELQDAVEDYTGLDISPTARRYFHKPFFEASATAMPFPDGSFDALWSIWTLEHIPNPERALSEMRRVVKPGGYLFLYPAFDVSRFSAEGLHVRPYSELTWRQKFLKTLIPIADSKVFHLLYAHQVRILRSLGVRITGGPSRFRFVRLEPNYERYWEGDSDATASFSNHELYLWFKTRGDTCLNCPSEARLTLRDHPLPFLILRKGSP